MDLPSRLFVQTSRTPNKRAPRPRDLLPMASLPRQFMAGAEAVSAGCKFVGCACSGWPVGLVSGARTLPSSHVSWTKAREMGQGFWFQRCCPCQAQIWPVQARPATTRADPRSPNSQLVCQHQPVWLPCDPIPGCQCQSVVRKLRGDLQQHSGMPTWHRQGTQRWSALRARSHHMSAKDHRLAVFSLTTLCLNIPRA